MVSEINYAHMTFWTVIGGFSDVSWIEVRVMDDTIMSFARVGTRNLLLMEAKETLTVLRF